jgi:stringent starvation protein B
VIEFSARFNGVGREISIPIGAVSAIYARENGQGLSFEVTASDAPAAAPAQSAETGEHDETPPEPPRPSGKPSLRRVK